MTCAFVFFEYDVRQIEVLSKFITDNPQMKISLEKLDFKELSYIYIDNLCNVLLDKNLFSRLVLNDIQKERLIEFLSEKISHPNYKGAIKTLSKPNKKKNNTRKII